MNTSPAAHPRVPSPPYGPELRRHLINVSTLTWPHLLLVAASYALLLVASLCLASSSAPWLDAPTELLATYLPVLGWTFVLTGAGSTHWAVHLFLTALMAATGWTPFPLSYARSPLHWWWAVVRTVLIAAVVTGLARHLLRLHHFPRLATMGLNALVIVLSLDTLSLKPPISITFTFTEPAASLSNSLRNLGFLLTPVFILFGAHLVEFIEMLSIRLTNIKTRLFPLSHSPTILLAVASAVVAIAYTVTIYSVFSILLHVLILAGLFLGVARLFVWLRTTSHDPAPHIPHYVIAFACIVWSYTALFAIFAPSYFMRERTYQIQPPSGPFEFSLRIPGTWQSEIVPNAQGLKFVRFFDYRTRFVTLAIFQVPIGPAYSRVDDWEEQRLVNPPRVAWRKTYGAADWWIVGYGQSEKELETRLPFLLKIRSTFTPEPQPPWQLIASRASGVAIGALLAAVGCILLTWSARKRVLPSVTTGLIFITLFGILWSIQMSGSLAFIIEGSLFGRLVELFGQATHPYLVILVIAAAMILIIARSPLRPIPGYGSLFDSEILRLHSSLLALMGISFMLDWLPEYGHARPIFLAIVTAIVFTWELGMSGETFTNGNSRLFPRDSRLYLFCGYMILVAGCIVRLGHRESSSELFNTEQWMSQALFAIGLPLVLAGFVARWMRLRSHSCVAS